MEPRAGTARATCRSGSFTHTDGAGFNTFVFTGRVRHHKLRSGSYRLQAVAALNGQTTAAVTLSFRIKR